MTELNEMYRCEVCGNILEVVHAGRCVPVCCEQPMKLLEPKTEDAGKEKHVPVVEYGKKLVVKVGSVPHPMEENHYIEWIEVITDDAVYRKHLKSGDEPKAEFEIPAVKKVKGPRCCPMSPAVRRVPDVKAVREYCNVHGLWKA
ncbi:desulfoferrodoxin [Methanosarcinales archaeon]|nr:MAG: desulfoferrodoxin [Methanosarcinales archaeon]